MNNDTNTYLGEIVAVLHEIHCELARAVKDGCGITAEEAMQRTGEAIRGSAETVTVTLPRDVVEYFTPEDWRSMANGLREDRWPNVVLPGLARLVEALADAQEAADTPQDAPVGRVGWLQRYKGREVLRHLVREVDGGWSCDNIDAPDFRADHYPDAVFTPIAMLPEGYVAVDREDLDYAVSVAEDNTEYPWANPELDRLRIALERSQS